MPVKIEVSPNSNWKFKEGVAGTCDVWNMGGDIGGNRPMLLHSPGSFHLLLYPEGSIGGMSFTVERGLGTYIRVHGRDLSSVSSDVEPEPLLEKPTFPDSRYPQHLFIPLVRQGAALWYQERGHIDYIRVVNLKPDDMVQ